MIERAWLQMGMPVSVRIEDGLASESDIDAIEALFEEINQRYSTYLPTSEVSRINDGSLELDDASDELRYVLSLCDQTRDETDGYFNSHRDGVLDPSGLVKGWAIQRASNLLTGRGYRNHFVEIGGDIQAVGTRGNGDPWRVGIRNPFQRDEVVKVLAISDLGVATSGTAIRGHHIYDPTTEAAAPDDFASLTVIAPTVFDADRLATAAFAMGARGIEFIGSLAGCEGYAIRHDGVATYTSGFDSHVW